MNEEYMISGWQNYKCCIDGKLIPAVPLSYVSILSLCQQQRNNEYCPKINAARYEIVNESTNLEVSLHGGADRRNCAFSLPQRRWK